MASHETREGRCVLVDKGDMVAGLVPWLAAALISGVVAFFVFLMGRSTGDFILSLFSLVSLAPAVWFNYQFIRKLLVWMRFEAGELEVTPWPIQMGDTVHLRFRRRVNGKAAVRWIEGSLECLESAGYTEGTSRTTATHLVLNRKFEAVADPMPGPDGALEAEWNVEIPPEGPPSFFAANNRIDWKVVANLVVDGWPDDDSEFALTVIPERAP